MSTESSRNQRRNVLGSFFSNLNKARGEDRTPADVEFAPDTGTAAPATAATPYVSPGLRLAASWSWRSIVVIAGVVLLVYGLSFVTIIVLPMLLALLISALLAPLTGWLTRHGMPRVLATILAFFGTIIVVLGLFTLVGQQLVVGFSTLTQQAVEGFNTVRDWLYSNPFGIDSKQIATWMDQGVSQATSFLQSNSSSILGGAVSAGASVGTFLTGLVLTLFTAFFFLYDGRSIFNWTINLLPKQARAKAKGAGLRGWQTLVQYVRVQIFVAAVDAVGIALGAFFLGLPLVIPLGVLVFLASFVPIVGAVLTGSIAVLIALVTHGFGAAIIMLIVVLGVQQLESNFLQPFIMGRAVSVHPLAVVLGVTAGGFLAGIPGAVFAVPAIAVANTVVKFLAGSDPLAPDEGGGREPRKGKKAKAGAAISAGAAGVSSSHSGEAGPGERGEAGEAAEEPQLRDDPDDSPLRHTIDEERAPEDGSGGEPRRDG